MENKTYSYKHFGIYSFINYVAMFFFTLVSLLQLFLIFRKIFIFADYLYIFKGLYSLLIFVAVATTVINFYQEFTITSEGIEFQVFMFWRKLIPWEEIIKVKASYIPWGKYQIVITKRLTFLHRIMGLLYGLTFNPSFIINESLIDYKEALRIIKRRRRK